MPTYAALIEYDGTNYCGWQRQSNGSSIQEELENALAICLRQDDVSVTGAGRTDAGVHARGQVAHFNVPSESFPVASKVAKSLNGLLPSDIAVRNLARTRDGFHARFDARSRRYHYCIALGPTALERRFRTQLHYTPDFDRMNAAARKLIGRYHFGAFCRTQSETSNRICHVTHAKWVDEGRRGQWRFEIQADRFLHGMVRSIVGTLLEIGKCKRSVESIVDTLASRDRRVAGPAAAAAGLVLEEVSYGVSLF